MANSFAINSNVSALIRGDGHSPVVLDGLRGIGISEKYLYDPRQIDLLKAEREGDKNSKQEVAR
jgi:hypothetical protein